MNGDGESRSTSSSTSSAEATARTDRRRSSWVIFSAPTTSTRSYWPEATAVTARCRAVDPVAQAFSTLTTGIPWIPMLRRATCPRTISWPVIRPAIAFPQNAAWTSAAATPASASADSTDSRTRARSGVASAFPNRVIPVPISAASTMPDILIDQPIYSKVCRASPAVTVGHPRRGESSDAGRVDTAPPVRTPPGSPAPAAPGDATTCRTRRITGLAEQMTGRSACMTVRVTRDLEAGELFTAWLARFADAIDAADPERLADCFVADGYWKDILAFGWEFRTYSGRDEIRDGFAATVRGTLPRAARPAHDRSGPRLLKRSGRRVVEGFLDVDT